MDPFTITNADKQRWPLVVSLPHSGTAIPEQMRQALIAGVLMPNTDWFLPDLYAFLPELGVTMIENRMSRYVTDPNRETKEAADGNYLGSVVYQQNTWRRRLYAKPLTAAQIQARLTKYYWPYHQALTELLAAKVAQFGHCVLIDLHSFAEYTHTDVRKPCQVVLGNRNDTASPRDLRKTAAEQFKAGGVLLALKLPAPASRTSAGAGVADDQRSVAGYLVPRSCRRRRTRRDRPLLWQSPFHASRSPWSSRLAPVCA